MRYIKSFVFRTRNGRRGVTLSEVLVVISVFGLLAALLLPAVQQARATARKTECANHLRQLGIAMNNVSESAGVFPTDEFCMLVLSPYFERPDIASAWNTPTMRSIQVPILYCPADPVMPSLKSDAMTYVVNDGSRLRFSLTSIGGRVSTRNGVRDPARWPVGRLVPNGPAPADFTDGLSHTALLSERLAASLEATGSRYGQHGLRRVWFTEERFLGVGQESVVAETCRSRITDSSINPLLSLDVANCKDYDHLLTPNLPGCMNGPDDGLYFTDEIRALPATSLHSGGVNVLLADGAVRFVSESVGQNTWWALGSLADGDITSEF